MPAYKLSEKGKAELKKTWTTTLVLSYIAIALIFSYSLLYTGRTMQDVAIFSVVVVALIASFIFGRKKYFAGVDNTEVTIDDDQVNMKALSQEGVNASYAEIKEIKQGKMGIELLIKGKRSIFIMNKFERFDEIEAAITLKVNNRLLQPTAG